MTDAELRKHKAYHEAAHGALVYKLRITSRPYGGSLKITIKEGSEKCSFAPDPNATPAAMREEQLIVCAGEGAEMMFFNKAGEQHTVDRNELLRLETAKHAYLGLPPPVDGEDHWIAGLMKEARAHLEEPEWKRLVEVWAENLLIQETVTFVPLVRLAVDVLGARGLPYQIHYLKKHDKGSVWTPTIECEGEILDKVLVLSVFQGEDMSHRHWMNQIEKVLELNGCEVQTIDGQDTILSFLHHCADTVEFMTINPVHAEGRFQAVSVNRISALL